MQKNAEALIRELESQEIPCGGVQEADGRTIVNCNVTGKATNYNVLFIFTADHDVEIAAMRLSVCPKEKRTKLYPIINDFNAQCRWGKLVIMPDGSVNMRCDAVITEESSGGICVELFLRLTRMIDDVYPSIGKALWSE